MRFTSLLSASFIVAIGVERLWLGSVTSARGRPESISSARREARRATGVRNRRKIATTVDGTGAQVRQSRDAQPEERSCSSSAASSWCQCSPTPRSRAPPYRGRPACPPTVESVVAPGTVVLTVPFATPSSSEAMAWAALDRHGVPDHRWLREHRGPRSTARPTATPPLPPAHVQEILSTPKLGSLLPYVPPAVAEAQLLTYLHRYSVGAVVFSAMGANTSLGYWYLIDTLGQPQIVRPGFAIWLPLTAAGPRVPWGDPPRGGARSRSLALFAGGTITEKDPGSSLATAGTVLAIAILIAIPAIFFTAADLFGGHLLLSGDNLLQNYPLRVLVGSDLRHGDPSLLGSVRVERHSAACGTERECLLPGNIAVRGHALRTPPGLSAGARVQFGRGGHVPPLQVVRGIGRRPRSSEPSASRSRVRCSRRPPSTSTWETALRRFPGPCSP